MRGQALKRIVSVALASLGPIAALPAVVEAQERTKVTKADVDRWSKELSNWGRWGKDDQLGTLNLITPETRKRAAALVKEGVSVSLSCDLETQTSTNNPTPLVHKMILPGGPEGGEMSLDSYEMTYHGLAYTHLDALCHVFPGGKLYNGFSAKEVTSKGAAKESIINVKGGVFTRGILIDIPRLKGVPYLEPGAHIYPEDLDAWEKKAGVHVGAGDAVFIRTGRWARQKDKGPWDLGKGAAGLDATCLKWIRDRDIALLGSDAASDVFPSGVEGSWVPIHEVAIPAIGVHLVDNADLEPLAEAAAKFGRWEFLLTLSPLAVVGGTGSPVNPIATY